VIVVIMFVIVVIMFVIVVVMFVIVFAMFVFMIVFTVIVAMVVLSTCLGKLGTKRFAIDGVTCLVEDSDVLYKPSHCLGLTDL
jgi:hypothetical protein